MTTNTLAARLANASVAVGALATDKRNAQQGYDYISADKILERCGDALAHAGVVLIPAITAEKMEQIETTTNRGPGTRYDVLVTFAMTLTDGETTLEFPWFGRGSDYAVPDKAMYKAITSGHKYFLMKLLNVGVGNEDGEHEVEPQQTPAPRTQGRTGQNPPRTQQTPHSAPPVQPQATLADDVPFDRDPYDRGENATGNPFDNAPWYAVARDNLTNGTRKFADAALGYHRDGEPASAKQYQYLVGLLDSTIKQATGADDGHPRVLAVLCQTEISSNNPPSKTLASKLLDKLATHKLVNGEKIENQAYDQSVADACVTIYRAAEAVATPQLFA